MRILLTLLLVIAALLPVRAVTQEAAPESNDLDAAIDEITVVGEQSLGVMRAKVTLAEDKVYALFNDLNEDDGYDIICKKETRIGSQIPKRVCLARMYRDALSQATEDEELGSLTVGKMPKGVKHQQILREKMRALAIEHPELLAALKERHALEQEFKRARASAYGESESQ